MRLIDADALADRMYHDAFETDTDMQKWDSGCWIRYKMFENAIEEAPTEDVNKLQTSAEPNKSVKYKSNLLDISNGEVSVSDMAGDLVSRKILIGAIEKCGEEKIYPQALIQTIKALPAAEQTIIGIDIPYGSDKGLATVFKGKDDKLILEKVKEICLDDFSIQPKTIVNDCDSISRDEAIKEWDKLSERGRTEFDQVLMTLPSADRQTQKYKLNDGTEIDLDEVSFEIGYTKGQFADRPKGEWIVENHEVVCSICGQNNLETNFCPNCGADMRKDQDR